MTVKAKILHDMKEAVSGGDKLRRTVTRLLLSELLYAESALPSEVEIDDVASEQVIRNYYNKLQKDVSNYTDASHRQDLHKQIAIVAQYLPKKPGAAPSKHSLLEA